MGHTFQRVPAASSVKSLAGGKSAVCRACSLAKRQTEETIANGLKLVRLRFRLRAGELPSLSVSELDKFLLFQLNGPGRGPTRFPRTWRNNRFQRLGRRERWELAHSVSSIKRNLPAGCFKHRPSRQKDWLASQTVDSPPPDPNYVSFVRDRVREVFRPRHGRHWDDSYRSFCNSFAPRPSSRYEPLTRGDIEWARDSNRKEYRFAVLQGAVPYFLDDVDFRIRYKEVLSAGKVRPLGIPSLDYDLLGPLHKTMYNHLTTQKWLLRGPPSTRRLSAFTGRYQTSVDLVNATDGLNLHVTRVILEEALSFTGSVPAEVKRWAMDSLSPSIRGTTESIRHGQMMGTYLSFPLLCLHSYCAGLWAANCKGMRGILVNGDDCAISSQEPVETADYPSGYVPNVKKTMISENTVEINSTCFTRDRKGKWQEVVHLRRGGAVSDFAGMRHMATAAVKAGSRWVSAFVHAGIGRSWRFLPSQLDLPTRNHDCWYRQKRMQRIHVDLPEKPPLPLDGRFILTDERPTEYQKWHFWEALFNAPREVGDGKEWNPRQREVLKGFPKRRLKTYSCGFQSHVSYNPKVYPKKPRKEKWLVPANLNVNYYEVGLLDWRGLSVRSVD